MGKEEVGGLTDLASPSIQSLVLTMCVSQSQASARAIRGLRKQLVWVSVRRTGEGSRTPGKTLSGLWPQAADRSGEGGGREPVPPAGNQPTGMWL